MSIDLTANAIASTAFASPAGIPPTRPHAISSTSPPFLTGGEWDHPVVYGGGHDVQHPPQQQKKQNSPTHLQLFLELFIDYYEVWF